ncbi:hypothetical protein D3C75_1131450 [compost metagenome]
MLQILHMNNLLIPERVSAGQNGIQLLPEQRKGLQLLIRRNDQPDINQARLQPFLHFGDRALMDGNLNSRISVLDRTDNLRHEVGGHYRIGADADQPLL